MIPRELDFADTAPVRAEGSAVVDGSPAEVWAVLVDHQGWSRWFPGVASAEPTSDPAEGLGSTRRVVLTGGSRFDERFIAWDEGECWAFTGEACRPGVMRGLVERCTIADLGHGTTRVTYRMAFEPTPAFRVVVPLLRLALPRALTKGMQGLAAEVVARRNAATPG